jgi:hypothetical protein
MGGLFKKPEVKKPEPVRMPVPEDDESKAAGLRQQEAIRRRSGRTSTIMSQRAGNRAGEAGTSAYGNSLLGQAG